MNSLGVGKPSPLKPTSEPKVTIIDLVMSPKSLGSPPSPPNLVNPKEGDPSPHMSPIIHATSILLAQPAQGRNLEDPMNEDHLNAMEEDMLESANNDICGDSQENYVNEEDMADSFLNLDPIQDLELSTESAKRRRVEEADEGLSRAVN